MSVSGLESSNVDVVAISNEGNIVVNNTEQNGQCCNCADRQTISPVSRELSAGQKDGDGVDADERAVTD